MTLYGAQAMAAQLAIHACENAVVFSANMRVNSAESRALGVAPAASMRAVRWTITWGAAQASSTCWRATEAEECFLGMSRSWQPRPHVDGTGLKSALRPTHPRKSECDPRHDGREGDKVHQQGRVS